MGGKGSKGGFPSWLRCLFVGLFSASALVAAPLGKSPNDKTKGAQGKRISGRALAKTPALPEPKGGAAPAPASGQGASPLPPVSPQPPSESPQVEGQAKEPEEFPQGGSEQPESPLSAQAPLVQEEHGGLLRDLDQVQQETMLLQAKLEREKLKKSLGEISAPSESQQRILSAEELKSEPLAKNEPKLVLVYGSGDLLRARLDFEGKFQSEVRVGDILPTGERVEEIKRNSIVLQKDGVSKRYFLG